ncbi:hypothetical protein PMIN03_004786 [Paraphaeosphaeria minitans]
MDLWTQIPKVFHFRTEIKSVENAPGHSSDTTGRVELIVESDAGPQHAAQQKHAAEIQMWWEEATVWNIDLPNGYAKVDVLLAKWEDELDGLNTRAEAEALSVVFCGRFYFVTETVELNVSSKPQQQMRTYMSAFIQKHDGTHSLLIVYCTGHGLYREDDKYLELTASLKPTVIQGLHQEARCNWNKIQEMLHDDDVDSDVFTILDTCYPSKVVKVGKEETRTFELLSACSIDSTTAAPGDNSFTRALIDILNGCTVDTARKASPRSTLIKRSPSTRDAMARRRTCGISNSIMIEFLTLQLSKAISDKLLVGLSRIDWLGIKPARITNFGRAALALYAIAQWKRICERQRKRRLEEVRLPDHSTTDEPPTTTPRKRSRDSFTDTSESVTILPPHIPRQL